MDGNSNEKFADIIAEQRHLAKSFKWKPAVRRRLKLIDRLEAAHQREVAELEREVAELRECLKEAVTEVCNRLEKCGFKEPCVFKTCYVQKWRKALKGAKDESK